MPPKRFDALGLPQHSHRTEACLVILILFEMRAGKSKKLKGRTRRFSHPSTVYLVSLIDCLVTPNARLVQQITYSQQKGRTQARHTQTSPDNLHIFETVIAIDRLGARFNSDKKTVRQGRRRYVNGIGDRVKDIITFCHALDQRLHDDIAAGGTGPKPKPHMYVGYYVDGWTMQLPVTYLADASSR